ncbi:hypothetical protein [Nakamurella sp. GG22]
MKFHKLATKRHDSAVDSARKTADAARLAHDAGIRRTEKELQGLRSPDGHRLGAYRGITLYQLSVTTPQGSSSLAGATAAVDTSGNLAVTRRGTVTRAVAGGLLFGPVGAIVGGAGFKKKTEHDSRELYLMVETPSLVSVVKCPPDQGMQARAFAAKIQTAAKRAAELEAKRPAMLADAEQRLAAARSDTKTVEATLLNLKEVKADPAMLLQIESTKRAIDVHFEAP